MGGDCTRSGTPFVCKDGPAVRPEPADRTGDIGESCEALSPACDPLAKTNAGAPLIVGAFKGAFEGALSRGLASSAWKNMGALLWTTWSIACTLRLS